MTLTLDAPGAVVAYDVREADADDGRPPLMLIGSPMDASGFATLSQHFPDRTIVTYDPRGVSRSRKEDPAIESTPDQHADDLHRVIAAVGRGPVDLFASSGGAVNALALVAEHPEDVRTLVAHEPPSASQLADREDALAAVQAIRAAYERDGFGPAMGLFMAITSHKGPIPADFAEQAPDGGADLHDDGRRDDAMFAQNLVTGSHYEPDYDALRAAPTRIVVAAGEESEGELAHRAALAVADRLGTEPVLFPSHHGGFLSGEFGWPGKPEAFAAKLREVLADEG